MAYVSRFLSKTEHRYSQLDKDALCIVFAVTKFPQYLIRRHFIIVSDHNPLRHLFASDKSIPPMASDNIQRWALLLSAYHYSITHRPDKDHTNADTLSRLLLVMTPVENDTAHTVLLFECLQVSPLSITNIRSGTDRDLLLSKERTFVFQGWPTHLQRENFRPFVRHKDELSVNDLVLFWGNRVIVPPKV